MTSEDQKINENLLKELKDIQNRKPHKDENCDAINWIYDLLFKHIQKNANVINENPKSKYIFSYAMVLFDYGIDICRLQEMQRNSSIQALSRDLLECYSYTKKLIYYFNTNEDDYNNYIKYLICEDMDQDRKIYSSLKNDITITDIETRNNEMQTILQRFKNLIRTHFPDELGNINENKLKQSLFDIVIKLKEHYNNIFPETKAERVGWAVQNNKAWSSENNGKPYNSSNVVYRALCHSTHNSISSIQERTVNSGYIMFNNDSKNILASLSLDFYCLKDIYDELVIISEKLSTK